MRLSLRPARLAPPVALLLGMLRPLAAQTAGRPPEPNEILEQRPVAPPTLRLRTGSVSQLVGELRVPAGRGPFPVAILVHGGCWMTRFGDDRYLYPMAEALRADEGIATWTIRYRRADETGGGWPGTYTDRAGARVFVGDTTNHFSMLDPASPFWEATHDAVRHALGLPATGRAGADRAALHAAYRTIEAGVHAKAVGPALAVLTPTSSTMASMAAAARA